jgi:hypothetical protein
VAEPITIPKIAADQDTDFEALYQQGISLLQQFSGDVWTDYNEHDPGVTILESLCYVLTELYDRTDIPIQDLLTDSQGAISYKQNAMYAATDILLNSATTSADYRKIIIDQVDEVNNVWVNPLYCNADPEQPVGIAGLYEVLVDLNVNTTGNDFLATKSEETNQVIQQSIADLLTSNRKISENFPVITLLNQVETVVSFNIYVKESVNAEQVLAEILFNIRHFLKPGVDFYTYEELAANGLSTEEIFDGPKLQNGFIPDSELQDKLSILYIDSLLKLIIQTEDVASADGISVMINNVTSSQKPYFEIPKDQTLYLDLLKSLNGISIYKKGVQYPYNRNHVISLFRELEGKKRKNRNFKFASQNNTIELPTGRYRDPAAYYSLQHEFPQVYGIGSSRLSSSAKNSRKAQALQLKAYLLFFEQMMADFMMQTASLGNLFSTATQERTYFYQPVYAVPDAAPLLTGFKGSPYEIYDSSQGHDYLKHCSEFVNNPENPYIKGLEQINKQADNFLQRRNGFLDHLLARFNFEVNLHPFLSGNEIISDVELSYSVQVKEQLLQNMADLTSSRGNFNPTDIGVNTSSKLFLGNLLHALSGIGYGDPTQDLLGNYSLLKPVTGSENGHLFHADDKGTIEINIHHPDFAIAMTMGLFPQNYQVEQDGADYFLVLNTGTSKTRIRRITKQESGNTSAITEKMQADLFSMYLQYENIFIIDHIRLLPDLSAEKFSWKKSIPSKDPLPAPTSYTDVLEAVGNAITNAGQSLVTTPDPVTGVSSDGKQFIHQDFYSARMSVVIRQAAAKAGDSTYANYFHNIAVNSVPAHICLEVFWLADDEYKGFLELYASFLLEQEEGKEQLTAFLLKQHAYTNFLTT